MFCLKLFGGASIESDAAPVAGPVAQRRRVALLALLAVSPRGAVSREKLAAYLFPEYDAERAHGALGDALHALRKGLGKEAILSVGDELRLNPDVIKSDVAEFEEALARGEREFAATLYAGPFLDGFFVPEAPELNRWVEGEQARLARAYARTLEELAGEQEARGDLTGAAETWHRVVALDPYSVRTTLCLMRALAASGDRAAAIRQARVYAVLVRDELRLEPDAEVEALAEQLRAEAARGRGAAPVTSAGPPAAGEDGWGTAAIEPEAKPSTSGLVDSETGSIAYAEIRSLTGLHASTAVLEAARTEPRRWWHRRWAWAGGISLIVLIVAGAEIWTWSRHASPAGVREPPIRALAVLPLENLSGDPAQDYFADGITDELITEVARMGQLRVISRTSVMAYKQTRKPLPQIARELGVDALVEGTVRRAGDRVRITAQLIRARDDAHLWAQSYERDVKDILALQREVAWAIAGGVRGTLTSGDTARAAPVRSLVPEAYDYYLRGKLYRRRVSESDVERAVVMLEQAVAIDPAFAAGYGELALAYAYLYATFQSGEAELAEKALLAAEKALSIEPGQPEAHLARGRVLWTPAYGYPHEGAIQEIQRALAQNPNSDEAHLALGQAYYHIGLLDEAVAELREALAINPVDPRPRLGIGQTLLYQMRPGEALAAFRQMPEDLSPPMRGPHAAWALFLLGRHAEAATVLESALAKPLGDRNGTISAMQAVLAAASGDHARAEEKIRLAATKQRGSVHFHHAEYSIAIAYTLMNRPDSAMKWLRITVEEGFPCYPLFARDPSLDRLRHDPRFIALLNELRAQWEGYRAQFGVNGGVAASRR